MLSSIKNDELNSDYHKDGSFMSHSGFREFIDCPAKYPAYIRKQKDKEEEKLSLGSLAHLAWLEQPKFKATCVHIDGPMNKNPWKKKADEAKEAGLIPVGDTDWKNIQGMLESLDKDPDACLLLKKGKQEVSTRWIDDETGVPMKCRFDTIILESGISGDLKTYNSVQMREVQRQIYRMNYHTQTAWYLRGASEIMQKKATTMVHVFVETEDPWLVLPYALDDASIERADMDVRDALKRIAVCLEHNVWPRPSFGIRSTSLPEFAFAYEGEHA